VALCAVASEPALVGIFMARGATWRKAHPSVVQILIRKDRALRRGDVLQIVAGAAAYAQVFAVEHKACRRVIESLWGRIPMHHLEVDAIVIGMAFDTCRAGRARSREGCMKAFVLLDLIRDFPMAIQAFERGRLNGNLVTLDAVPGSTQALMGFRKRSRRDLRANSTCSRQKHSQCDQPAELRRPSPRFSASPCAAFKGRRDLRLSLAHRTD
jgi:hypothetical protein